MRIILPKIKIMAISWKFWANLLLNWYIVRGNIKILYMSLQKYEYFCRLLKWMRQWYGYPNYIVKEECCSDFI